ncbi:MAG TPA: hypothetical protein VK213_02990, partial [Bacteroidales bacterium]|nr:hypothetical protein [Bacteroidales bacterium]
MNKKYAEKLMQLKKAVTTMAVFLLFSGSVFGQAAGDYRSIATGNWNAIATWEYYNGASWVAATDYPGQVVGAKTITISSGHRVTLNLSPANSIQNLTFATGNTANTEVLFGGVFTLTVSGAINYTPSASNFDQVINVNTGTLNCASITMVAPGTGARREELNITTGIVNISGDLTMVTGGSNRLSLGSGTLNIGGNFNYTGGNFAAGTGTVNYNGAGNQVIGAVTYNNLYASTSGIKSIPVDLTIGGYFDINNTASVNVTANVNFTGPTMTVNSTAANAFTATSGIFTFNAGGPQSVANVAGAGAITFFDVVAANSGTKTINRNVTIRNLTIVPGVTVDLGNLSPMLTITGNMAVNGAFSYGTINAKIVNLTGNLSGTGSINMTSDLAHQLNLGGINNAITTFNTAGTTRGIVNYNRAGDQQVFASANYQNMVVSGGGIKSLQGATTVNQNVNLANGVLNLGGNNLTITNNSATAITGVFDNTKMIQTGGTGYLLRPASTPAPILFPVGSAGFYSPSRISVTAGGTTGTISIRAVPDASSGTLFIPRYWDVIASAGGQTITAVFQYDLSEITVTPTNVWYRPGVAPWNAPPTGTTSFGANFFTVTGTSAITTTSTHWTGSALQIYYSYQTGDWNTANTWTSDPSGTLQIGSTIPGSNSKVVILDGRTVSMTSDIASTGLDISIEAGGILSQTDKRFTNPLMALGGQGTLQLQTSNFPSVVPAANNTFILTGGGTTEYNPIAGIDLPVTQAIYNNLTVNTFTPQVVRQLSDITLNGNLRVMNGTLQINDNNPARRRLTISGNVTVEATGAISVGTGNTVTGGHTPVTTTPGGVAPFINYYDQETHRIVVNGDFTNKGTVRFTNQAWPVYNAFPADGAATVYFTGNTNNVVSCEGRTDFYNIVVDKGSDQTYTLTINPTTYGNFSLYGANNANYEGAVGANPVLRKALWIRNGSLVLTGYSIIPSLTEANAGTADYFIPANGAMILDGPDVVVLATADDYREVNAAYGLAGGTGLVNGVIKGSSGISINGRLQVNNGYLSTRESSGLITWDYSSGQLVINDGVIDTKQFRAAGGSAGLASYSQGGGTMLLRGRYQRNTGAIASVADIVNATINTTRDASSLNPGVGTFNLNAAANVFTVTGGTIRILDATGAGGRVFDVFSSAGNINVTGGKTELIPTTGSGGDPVSWFVASNAPFYDLLVDKTSSITDVRPDAGYPDLLIIRDLSLNNGAILNTNNKNVSVGRNFAIGSSATYYSLKSTIFNGTGSQIFTIDGTVDNGASGLRNLSINKSSGTLSLAGSKPSLTVQGTFDLSNGTFDDGGKSVYVAGNITNSGIHISTPGTGFIELNGTTSQIIGGNGLGAFNNVRLNNTDLASPVTLAAGATITGALTFVSDKILDISTFNLTINSGASIVNAGTGNRYIKTAGNAGDGGLTKVYSDKTPFLFPVGAPSTSHPGNSLYTPATIGFSSDPSTFGSITVVLAGYEHPATTVNNVSLTYFWRVKSTGFTGFADKVIHSFQYDQADVAGVEGTYVPAFFNRSTSVWNPGPAGSINTGTNTISDWTDSDDFIDADFTAGDISAFGAPKIYYSRQTGLWSVPATWSLTSHVVDNVPATVPGINDIVIIGDNDIITLYNDPAYSLNTATVSCASLQIEAGSVLDIGNNPGSVFSMVQNHPSGNNGTFRVTTTRAFAGGGNEIRQFLFPSGDFSDFDVNKGTTEFYTTTDFFNSLYILPPKAIFGNIIISPYIKDNMVFPNVPFITVYGDLTLKGTTELSATGISWNTNDPEFGMSPAYTTVEKTVHILGNMNVNGGSLIFYDDNQPQHLIVDKDVNVAAGNGANIWVMDAAAGIIPNFGGAPMNNTFEIGGNLNNNGGSYLGIFDGVKLLNFTHYVDVTFSGNTNSVITGTGADIFRKVTINKGSSPATTITVNSSGNFSTPVDNWLICQNGTLIYDRTGNLNISTVTDITIPGTSGLTINTPSNVYISNSATNNRVLKLDGRFTLLSGNVYIGPANNTANNADIEYSGAGTSALDIQGGQLIINGQVRRSLSSTSGELNYSQSNGTVVIYGNNANVTRGKLEVTTGGSFNMSGGSLTIVKGGATSGDLYLRPSSGTVTGGTIIFTEAPSVGPAIGTAQNYLLDATIPLNNLTITGTAALNATVGLSVNPLQLNGSLVLTNTRSILNSNNLNVSLKGNLVNNGTYNYGTNQTTFNGGIQTISGTTVSNFYDLMVSPVTTLTVSNGFIVNRNLALTSGNFILGANQVEVLGDLFNGGAFSDNNTTGGLRLAGAYKQQISGTGSYGRIELDNVNGANLNNDIVLQNNLYLKNGVLDINIYMLTLNQGSNLEGAPFGINNMIQSDGVISNFGTRKFFPAAYAGTFTFPSGVSGKFTPAIFTITGSPTAGSIRVNPVNNTHISCIDPANALKFYWQIESNGITAFNADLALKYLESDIAGTESNYVSAKLEKPGNYWRKALASDDHVDEATNLITFHYLGDNNLNGEYTAGNYDAFPGEVPTYQSVGTGNWSDAANWINVAPSPPCPVGGPFGANVIINSDITVNINGALALTTTINSGKKLIVTPTTFGHNLGDVSGAGTLVLGNGTLPGGNYFNFLDCSANGILEYGGTGDYTIVAALFSSLPNVRFTGTGRRILPNKDLTFCKSLVIDGATLDNSVNNTKLTILGTMERYNAGVFTAGTGASPAATVSFTGTSAQTIGGPTGDFTGTSKFNNLEINNPAGLTIGLNGSVEAGNQLLLTNGNITTSATDKLILTSNAANVVIPAGGSATSFVNGPLIKQIVNGGTFLYPIGKGSTLGHNFTLTNTAGSSQLWTAEFFIPAIPPTASDLNLPLEALNTKEYWSVTAPVAATAKVKIGWDLTSDLNPHLTVNGMVDMRVAELAAGKWNELVSSTSGSDDVGDVSSSNDINFTAGATKSFTSGSITTRKPRAAFSPAGPVCGLTSGIPVTFTSFDPISPDFTITYTRNNVLQAPVTFTALDVPPYILTTSAYADYKLVSFTYYQGAILKTGVVDPTIVTVGAPATVANAGTDQSLCGATGYMLAGNVPAGGETGLWTIISGTGGALVNNTLFNTNFTGTSGETYTLRWTITRGLCTSSDDVVIAFPVVAAQPAGFTSFFTEVCQGAGGYVFTVPMVGSNEYIWNYAGGSGATIVGAPSNSVTIAFDATATNGTLEVQAKNGCGTSAARTLPITVNTRPAAVAGPAKSICLGETTTIGAAAVAGSTYSWSSVPAGFSSTDPQPSVSPVVTTTYTVVETNIKGCSNMNSVVVTVNSLPAPTIGGLSPVCVNTSATYTTEAGNTEYAWVVPVEGTIAAGGGTGDNSVTIFWNTAGSHTISVNYKNASGCLATTPTTRAISVTAAPTPSFTVEPGANVCVGEDIIYTTQTGGGINSYVWVIPGTPAVNYNIVGGSTATNSVTIRWLTPGSKNVTVNYKNAGGCTSSTPASNTTNANPAAVPTFTAAPGVTTCAGTSVTYTTEPAMTNYVWNVPGTAGSDYTITGGGTGATDNTVTLTWNTAGVKNVTVNYSNGSCSGASPASNSTTVTVVAAPTGSAAQSFCAIDNPDLGDIVVVGAGIKWYAANTGGAPLLITQSLVSGTTYYATQTVGTCESDTRLAVTVTVNDPAAPVAGPNTYTYDGFVKTATATVGAGETIDWYTAASGGVLTTAPSGTNAGTYSAYAETRNILAGCLSATRTLITLTINPAALTIDANDVTKSYGTAITGAAGSAAFTATGLQNGETVGTVTIAYGSGAAATDAVGTYANQVTPSLATGGTFNAANYTITYTNGDIIVTAAALTIDANDVTKSYGTAITGAAGSAAFTATGLQNGETVGTVTIAYGTGAAATDAVGTYANQVTPSLATGGTFNAANYTITYTNGDIIVTAAALTIDANDVTKSYGTAIAGGAGSAAFTATGLQNGETVGTITIAYGTGAAATDATGTYANQVTPSL